MIFKVSCETEDLLHRNKTYFQIYFKKENSLYFVKIFTLFHNLLLLLLFIVKMFHNISQFIIIIILFTYLL